jgi:hypothetical protein
MLMLRLLTVIASVPNALPKTVKLWFCNKMASHSARADQLPAKAHSTPRPTVAPKFLLLLVLVKEAGTLLTVTKFAGRHRYSSIRPSSGFRPHRVSAKKG